MTNVEYMSLDLEQHTPKNLVERLNELDEEGWHPLFSLNCRYSEYYSYADGGNGETYAHNDHILLLARTKRPREIKPAADVTLVPKVLQSDKIKEVD